MIPLMSPLSPATCAERLENAIDPIPPEAERVRSVLKTTANPYPLRHAGRRTVGFGYSPGTRPVVGTITDGQFHLEKRDVLYGGNSPGTPIIEVYCTGQLSPITHGTLIEVAFEQPKRFRSSLAALAIVAAIAPLPLICLLASYTGQELDRGSTLGFCIFVLFAVVPLVVLKLEATTSKVKEAYLLRFVKEVCEATPVESSPQDDAAYTGVTHRLS